MLMFGVMGTRGGDWDWAMFGRGEGECGICGDIECWPLTCTPFRITGRAPFADGERTGTACPTLGLDT